MHVTIWEIALLAVLIAASVGLFWLRFRKVVSAVRHARTTPDFPLQPLGWRAWRFISEVLLQVKVIKDRPLAGIAHAFVFWGFCAFALITVNHIAMGFGYTLLSRESAFGRFYYGFVAAFAVAVAVSIVAWRSAVSSCGPSGSDRFRPSPASSHSSSLR